jgi:hypothetical protein
MLSVDDVLTSSGKYPERAKFATMAIRINAQSLIEKINKLATSFQNGHPKPDKILLSSGFRPPLVNAATPGASATSWHMTGHAVDIADPAGNLALFCSLETSLLEHFGLYLEDPRWTRKIKQADGSWKHRWVHLQAKAPPSGRRIFRPAGPEPR